MKQTASPPIPPIPPIPTLLPQVNGTFDPVSDNNQENGDKCNNSTILIIVQNNIPRIPKKLFKNPKSSIHPMPNNLTSQHTLVICDTKIQPGI